MVNILDCDLTCDIIDDPRSKILIFPRQIVQGYQTPFEFLKSVQWFRRSEGEGKK